MVGKMEEVTYKEFVMMAEDLAATWEDIALSSDKQIVTKYESEQNDPSFDALAYRIRVTTAMNILGQYYIVLPS
jgi:hypothetical protein